MLQLHLSDVAFVVCWCCVLGFHVLNIVFLSGSMGLYWYLNDPNLGYLVAVVGLVRPSLRQLASFLLLLITLLHVRAIVQCLHASYRRGFPSFGNEPLKSSTQVHPKTAEVEADNQPKAPSVWRRLFGRHGLLGAESPHFELVFSIRELFEVGVQTYQLYTMSLNIADHRINRFCVGMLAINCMSTPLIHTILKLLTTRGWFPTVDQQRQRDALQRVLCLLSDMALDFCCSVAIPFVIFVPYWREYDTEGYNFPVEREYDPVWYANAVHEAQQVLIVSGLDFVATVMPHLSLVFVLSTVKKFICRRSSASSNHQSGSESTAASKDDARRAGRIHLLACCWGLGVVIIHVAFTRSDGTMHERLPDCLLSVHAWFVTKLPCTVQAVNCYRRNITGTADQLNAILDQLDPLTLMMLKFTHCPALEMPSRVANLTRLYGIEVFNSTIKQWNQDAQLTEQWHPRLSFIELFHVNFTDGQLPIGVLSDQLPPSVAGIEMYNTNLQTLPDDLYTSWRNVDVLYLENCQFTAFPDALLHMPWVDYLSLAQNAIPSIPASFLNHSQSEMKEFCISSNPIAELPSTIHENLKLHLMEFLAEATDIANVPAWMQELYHERMEQYDYVLFGLFDSPFCDAATADNNSSIMDGESSSGDHDFVAQSCEDYKTASGLHPEDIILARYHP